MYRPNIETITQGTCVLWLPRHVLFWVDVAKALSISKRAVFTKFPPSLPSIARQKIGRVLDAEAVTWFREDEYVTSIPGPQSRVGETKQQILGAFMKERRARDSLSGRK